MPLSKPAPPPDREFSDLGDYKGKIVILTPIAEDIIETAKFGPRKVVKATGSVYDEATRKCSGLGEVTVWWAKVQAQLTEALEQERTVVGRLIQKGRAYELEGLDDATQAEVEKAYDWE
jgi:cysteinyl-tRNA synthetase